MTTQEKLQAITRAIQEVCPDLVEVRHLHYCMQYPCQCRQEDLEERKEYKPITISHILRWLYSLNECLYIRFDGVICEVDYGGVSYLSEYSLEKDTLDQQSPEFIDFLYSLLPTV